MAEATQPEVEVTHRPERTRPSVTAIPKLLLDYFAGQNRQLGLRAKNEIMRASDATVGWKNVDYKKLPPNIKSAARASFEISPENAVLRGDLVLCQRTFEARDEQRYWQEQERQQIEGAEYIREQLDSTVGGLARESGYSPGIGLTTGTLRPVREDVLGGAEAVRQGQIAQDVLEAVEDAKRQKAKG